MAKLVLSSDYHLNFNAPFNRLTADGKSSRVDEILSSALWAAEIGKRNGAEYFINLGDSFERADKLPTKEGQHVLECFTEISRMYGKSKHIALRGNHCILNEDYSIMNLFSNTLTVVNKPTFIDVDGGRLFFCSYIRDSEDLYDVLNQLQEYDCLGRKYLFAHFWTNDVMAVDSDAIDIAKFNHRFFDRILLGHYHAPSNATDNLITYVGTLLNKTFGETGPKGCWVLDTLTNNIEFFENPISPEFFTTTDDSILSNPADIISNAYYKVSASADSLSHLNSVLANTKGFELISKGSGDSESTQQVSISSIEKNNSLSLRDFIFKNAATYCPDNVSLDTFINRGKDLLGNL